MCAGENLLPSAISEMKRSWAKPDVTKRNPQMHLRLICVKINWGSGLCKAGEHSHADDACLVRRRPSKNDVIVSRKAPVVLSTLRGFKILGEVRAL